LLAYSGVRNYINYSNNKEMNMIRKSVQKQLKLEFISIEDMVPEDHLLRMIDRNMDFGFVRERLYPLYCPDNGQGD
jgi:hypothetical protein